ncbi:hypothetical protein [Pedobacter zeae]|uniref:DUF3168 domain-containing protein n=1 Tax=Pedobacter zeae TaxID=1737356 RepID=A0A7W6K7J7_9SPHI|nr:hypothetical protein [Pedobacter zeae]MBB4106631.1 hypothetical protein [Pedobacter zeae]GGH02830.1 hypothetical protein GCM10007422_17510 [Pedobacter zeae]
MTEAFLKLLELLMPSEVPTDPKLKEIYDQLKKIEWFDLDKDQLENYDVRPAVAFPCALIKIDIPGATDMGNKVQQCMYRIRIRLGFDYTGDTSAINNIEAIMAGMEYAYITQAVYQTLQGTILAGMGKLSRRSQVDEERGDGFKVMNLEFTMGAVDQSAA